MNETLQVGTKHTLEYVVPEDKTVPHLYPEAEPFQQMPEVFATGFLVGLMEWAAIEALAPHMEDGEGSVGTKINISHTAATPPGLKVTIDVECTDVDRKRTVWKIEARDEVEVIGKGIHERYAVRWDRFKASLAEKTPCDRAGYSSTNRSGG